MTETPSVLFMSCSDTHPEEIIKLLLDVSELPEKIVIDESIHAYPWHINNKYYEADVHLCSLLRKSISNEKFSDTVQAIVLHFDSSKNDSLDKVDSWLPFINEYHPEIKILLCKNVKDDDCVSCSKRSVQEWCVGKGFELVELEPIIEEEEDDEVEDDFPETTGIQRIIQALNAHVWPNLVMKTEQGKPNSSKNPVDYVQNELNVFKEQFCLEESLEELLEKDDDFSELFSQLPDMKARVANLSGADRKAAAEQVVKAFWRALDGDDDDEFLDL